MSITAIKTAIKSSSLYKGHKQTEYVGFSIARLTVKQAQAYNEALATIQVDGVDYVVVGTVANVAELTSGQLDNIYASSLTATIKDKHLFFTTKGFFMACILASEFVAAPTDIEVVECVMELREVTRFTTPMLSASACIVAEKIVAKLSAGEDFEGFEHFLKWIEYGICRHLVNEYRAKCIADEPVLASWLEFKVPSSITMEWAKRNGFSTHLRHIGSFVHIFAEKAYTELKRTKELVLIADLNGFIFAQTRPLAAEISKEIFNEVNSPCNPVETLLQNDYTTEQANSANQSEPAIIDVCADNTFASINTTAAEALKLPKKDPARPARLPLPESFSPQNPKEIIGFFTDDAEFLNNPHSTKPVRGFSAAVYVGKDILEFVFESVNNTYFSMVGYVYDSLEAYQVSHRGFVGTSAMLFPKMETLNINMLHTAYTLFYNEFFKRLPVDSFIAANDFAAFPNPVGASIATMERIIGFFEPLPTNKEDDMKFVLNVGETQYKVVGWGNPLEYSLLINGTFVLGWEQSPQTELSTEDVLEDAYQFVYKDLCQISAYSAPETLICLYPHTNNSDATINAVLNNYVIGINREEGKMIFNAKAWFDRKINRWVCEGTNYQTNKKAFSTIDACYLINYPKPKI